jgi:hypothetical protein
MYVHHTGGSVNIYINNRLILSEIDPTPYQILFALSEHIKGFDLNPFLTDDPIHFRDGQPVLEEEYA